MTPAQREQLRLSILRYLSANPTRFGMGAQLLRQYLVAEGSPADDASLDAELLYLSDKGLIQEAAKPISPEMRSWRITATGRDLFAQTHGG